MVTQAAIAVENNFKQGLHTEASGLNFPENACTETYDCIFKLNGTVERRLGFGFEEGYVEKTIDRTDSAVSTFLWKNVSGDGDINLFVVQIGGTLYFYETDETSVSAGAISSTLTLSTYLASGAPSPNLLECQFSSGNKYLIVTHPYCDPFYVSYNSSTQVVTGTLITLKIRDFEGDTADSNAVDTRPTSTLAALNVSHYYNLLNQGWTATNLTTWDGARTDMPSNSDVMWRFKNSSDAFDTTTVANVISGNSPAPKGHYILTLSNQDRDAISGLSGTTDTLTSYLRPSTSAWFGGRVFYSGLNYAGFNSSIYFSQILERDSQYGLCYQANDPTSEDLFDLLPSDGGVIKIPEAGTIFKLVAIIGGLIIFANNGVWSITGSTGLGFKANDYTVQKISSINAISATSFVDIAGFPAWWNAEGIHIINTETGAPTVKSLTLTTIKSFYDDIPPTSKLTARGFYNTVAGIVQWIYRSSEAATPTETYTFDRILNFNVVTGAFYPWIIPDTDVTVNGIVVLDGSHGIISQMDIVDDTPNDIVDDSGNTVVSFEFVSSSGGAVPSFKYLTSYVSGSSYKVLLGEVNNSEYLDWKSYDTVGTSFTSYFITGYKIRGKGLMKFNPMWVTTYSDTESAVQYYFQAIWDYATTGSGTGRWSPREYISHSDTNYSNTARRIKVRGHGRTLQFKVTSVEGQRFSLLGWSTLDVGNSLP